MTCAEYKAALLSGAELAGASEHVADCDSCRVLGDSPELVELLGSGFSDMPSAEEEASISGAEVSLPNGSQFEISDYVEGETSKLDWLRDLPTRFRVSMILGFFAALVVFVRMTKGRADWLQYPGLRLTAELGVLAGIIGLTLVVALRPMYLPSIRRVPSTILVGLALTVPVAFALLPIAHTAHPSSLAGLGVDLVPRAWGCFKFGSLFALVSVASVLLMSRSSAFASHLRLAAASSGVVGVTILQVHCPLTGNAHLLWGHSSVAVVMISAGLLFSKILQMRTSNLRTSG